MVPRGIIFDFFGVICSEIAPLWTRKHLPQADVHTIHERYIRAGDSGAASEEKVFGDLSEVSGESTADIAREWHDLIAIDEAVVGVIRGLRGSHKLGLCSNAWGSFIHPIFSEHHLVELFDDILISSEVGMTKPDERIFRLAASRLGLEPHECAFVDDSEHNIAAAEAVGMRGVLFRSVADLSVLTDDRPL
jgi:putative hydrolase of the HAD superfamily